MGLVATTLTEPSETRAQVIAFQIDADEGVKTAPGKGLPHAQAVADILRDAGYNQCPAGRRPPARRGRGHAVQHP